MLFKHFRAKNLVLTIVFLVATLFNYAQQGNHSMDVSNRGYWKLSSIPRQPLLFPECNLQEDLAIGYNRAGLSWFVYDPRFFPGTGVFNIGIDSIHLKNHFVRPVLETELFPELLNSNGTVCQLSILNITYNPSERGPYNYEVSPTIYSSGSDSLGQLINPASRWGGISRRIELNNVFFNPWLNYIGFWLMDPFVYDTLGNHGTFMIQLGNVSEDVLKDGLSSQECNLPTNPFYITDVDTTIWGRISNIPVYVDGFSNNPDSRQYQDVGFDGLRDTDERIFFQDYLIDLAVKYGINSTAYQAAQEDPSSDNYLFYLDNSYDQLNSGIPERYSKYNGIDGNSCADYFSEVDIWATRMPDGEDMNWNATLDTAENYFQYRINLDRGQMVTGQNFITKKITVIPSNGDGTPVNWYRFHIPIHTNQKEEFGSILMADSSMFLRLILKDFANPVHLRLAAFQLMEGDFSKPVVNQPGKVLIYPNPVQDFLKILYRDEGLRSISISDMAGREVIAEETLYDQFYHVADVSALKSGIYLIRIKSLTNNFVLKFIKVD